MSSKKVSNKIVNIFALILALYWYSKFTLLEFSDDGIFIVYYVVVIVYLLTTGAKIKINGLGILLSAALISSVLFNEIPAFFQADLRLMAFLLSLGLFGPLFFSKEFRLFRLKLFVFFSWMNLIVNVISFIGLIIGNEMVFGRGGFTGLYQHSMVMGPMSAMSCIFSIYQLFKRNNNLTKMVMLFFVVISLMNCISAASRAALIGLFASLLTYFKIKLDFRKFVNLLSVMILLVIVSKPLWSSFTDEIIRKMEYAEEEGSFAATRSNLWNQRLAEFMSAPLFGIGFASVDIYTLSQEQLSRGTIEPGSSWLAILSMTGIFGFLAVSLLLLEGLGSFATTNSISEMRNVKGLSVALMVFFTLHFFAEGYIFAAGSFLFVAFWLTIGTIIDWYNREKDYFL